MKLTDRQTGYVDCMCVCQSVCSLMVAARGIKIRSLAGEKGRKLGGSDLEQLNPSYMSYAMGYLIGLTLLCQLMFSIF